MPTQEILERLSRLDQAVWLGQRFSGDPAGNKAITIDYILYNLLLIAVLHILNWQTSYQGEPKANYKAAARPAGEKFHEDACVQSQIRSCTLMKAKAKPRSASSCTRQVVGEKSPDFDLVG